LIVPVGLASAYRLSVLLHRGQLAEGQIVGVSGPMGKHNTFDITYAFTPPGTTIPPARLHKGVAHGTDEDVAAVRQARPLEVLFNPAEPEQSDLALLVRQRGQHPYRRLLDVLAPAGGLLLVFFIAGGRNEYLRQKREAYLLAHGELAAAEIGDVERVTGRYGVSLRVRFSFQGPEGQAWEGTQRSISAGPEPRQWERSAALAEILKAKTVLYDPQKPQRNMLYPGRLLRCRKPPEPDAARSQAATLC